MALTRARLHGELKVVIDENPATELNPTMKQEEASSIIGGTVGGVVLLLLLVVVVIGTVVVCHKQR